MIEGTRIGPYEIKAPLGEGGMGVVFRARDVKLQRDVALKVLPQHFASNADRLQRFQREAQLLATLNHPNIAQIYGLEESKDTLCIVMELVEGETLQERLKRGPIPADEALSLAIQIAEALESAHERGIVHRDLKPGNIMVLQDHKVKVLDFGLAKALRDETQPSLSNSPTLVSGSAPGMILGTAAYMSPEQARGKEADRTSDVWAFGCVFYEMLTARSAFEGESVGEILAAIFKDTPDWQRLPTETSEGIRRLLRRCLQKDRKVRLHDIADARIEIAEALSPLESESAIARKPAEKPARRLADRLAWVAVGVVLATAIVMGIAYFKSPAEEANAIRFTVPIEQNLQGFAISPDGRHLVFSASQKSEAEPVLWLRKLDETVAEPMAGTEGGTAPFWSPDGRFIGFFSQAKLKKIELGANRSQTLSDAAISRDARAGTWGSNGIILFSTGTGGGIFQVSAAGGTPRQATTLDPAQGDRSHQIPQFLPDGQRFLYFRASTNAEINGSYVGSLDGATPMRIGNSRGLYAPPGLFIFSRTDVLVAQHFNLQALELTGEPVTIVNERVNNLSVSNNGILAYRAVQGSQNNNQLVWLDREGKHLGTLGEKGDYYMPRLSPDGKKLAVEHHNQQGTGDVEMFDLARGTSTRFTFDPTHHNAGATWSPDGTRLAFHSTRNRNGISIYVKAVAGSTAEDLMLSGGAYPSDWTPDGRFIIYGTAASGTRGDIWMLPVTGDRKPQAILQTPFDEIQGQVSPDGHWLAYASDESGTTEVYVSPFPPTGGKWQVSNGGGDTPKWRRDGRELFYIGSNQTVTAVSITTGPSSFEAGKPKGLFQSSIRPRNGDFWFYDVSADGQRFLGVSILSENSSVPLTVIVNWPMVLSRK